jgi:thiol-disulfide isomerase/thioredoxin
MPFFAKFLIVAAMVAAGWYVKDHRDSQARNFRSEAGQKLQMLQGSMPGEGKPVVLEFWGTYCGPCVRSIPQLNKLHAKFGQKVQFIAVSGESAQTVRGFMSRTQMSYPVAVDPSREFSSKWKIKGVPTLIFLDANQKEQWRGHAMELTDAKMAELLKG